MLMIHNVDDVDDVAHVEDVDEAEGEAEAEEDDDVPPLRVSSMVCDITVSLAYSGIVVSWY